MRLNPKARSARAYAIAALLVVCTASPAVGIGTRSANTSLAVPQVPESFGYQLENAFPGLSFSQPVAVVTRPGDADSLFVVERAGMVYVIPDVSSPAKSVFLDLTAEVDSSQGEEGLFSLAFHPDWQANGYFFVHYTATATTSDDSGRHGRISRFGLDAGDPDLADPGSEQPLISQFDQDWNHNGGELKFGPDGYLYASLGDEGGSGDNRNNSRSIDKDYFSAILRLDVDKLPDGLEPNPHPAVHLDGGGLAYYSVPPDNPFIGATSFNAETVDPSAVRTEFWAAGLRNPWRFSFDEATGLLYCADVGQNAYEEVNIIKKGGDYGWRLREGLHPYNGNTVPAGVVLEDPILEYPQSNGPVIPGGKAEGKSVTGGVVYRGNRISQLEGFYLFADYVGNRLFAARYDPLTGVVHDFQQLAMVSNPVSFALDPSNGDALIASLSGTVYRLVYSETSTGDPLPATLSSTGAFSDLAALAPETGIEPYDINVPFWSDHAIKSRWFSVPDLADTIGFDATGNWSFPDGTIWIKHFDMEMVEGDPLSKRRLETRFLVKNADGIHGFTYKWNAGETDALLVDEEGEDEVLTILDSGGGVARTQTWRYPSRSECLQCHTSVGGYALGFNTRQLNGDYDYGAGALNQIGALDSVGYFGASPGDPGLLDKLHPGSHPTATAEVKARSYLEANCVQCHQPGGPSQGSWDARILTSLASAGIVDGELVNNQGDPDNKVISAGDLVHSMILQRISTRGALQMPPLGSNEVDQDGISVISAWITALGGEGASPVLSASRSSFTFTEGDSEMVVDSGIDVSDSDTSNFSGGSLTASLVGTDGLDDRLSIQNQGSGPGQIGVSGNTVSYQGTPIGTMSGGDSFSSPLVVSLTSSVSSAAMSALCQAVTFQNLSSTPLVFDRTLELLVTDEASLVSNSLSYLITIDSIPEDPAVTWDTPSDIVYGTALSGAQLDASASVDGSFAYSPAFGTVLGAGPGQTLLATFTPSDTQNYNEVVESVEINVTKALATLTAADAQRPYGSSNPAFSFSASGLVNGDVAADIDTHPALTTTATASSPAGSYPITASGAADSNYSFEYVSDTLTVQPANLTIQVDDIGRVYGQPNPALTASYTGFVLEEGPSDLDSPATLSTSASPTSSPGTYSIGASGASDANYSIVHVSGLLTITKATTTLTPTDADRLYGSENPPFAYTVTGLVLGDTIDDLDVPPTLSTSATASSPTGSYPINATGASDSHYTFIYASGSLSIQPAPLTIAANNKTRPFGQPNPEFTATYTGFVLGESHDNLDTQAIFATTAQANSSVGNYPITATGASDTNYTITFEEGTLTVSKAIATLTALDTQRPYGSSDPALEFEVSGLLDGDTVSDIDVLPVLSTTATFSSPAGSYPIDLSGASDTDYDFLYAPGNLTIEPALLTISADSKARVYGELNPPLTATYSGFVLGEGPEDLDSPVGLTTPATSASPVGDYLITASGASALNYNVSYETGAMSVSKAEATLTAVDAQRAYGSPNPTFTFNATGLVNGDISLADIDTHPTLSSTATIESPPGSYTINISGADDPNYTFSYTAGTLGVTPAPLTIAADDKERGFGLPNPELTATYTGFVLGQSPADLDTLPILETSATADSPSDLYPITISGASDSNYAITYENGSLSVGRALVTLTANDFQRVYGAPNPDFTYSASGLMNGDTLADLDSPPTLSTTASQNTGAGTYSIDLSGADDSNYFFSYKTGTLEIAPASLTASTSNTIRPYGSPNPAFSIDYDGFTLGETTADLDTPPSVLTTALVDSPVGEYAIELSGGSDPNYTFTYEPATISIEPAPLTVAADNKARPYGQPNPALTATYSGFVLGEGPQNLETAAALETNAVAASAVGSYPITVSGAASTNYTIAFVDGDLEVQKAIATLTAADVQRQYGADNPPFSFTASGLASSDSLDGIDTPPSLSTSASNSSPPGTYPIVLSGASDSNYSFVYEPGSLIVDLAPLTISADNKSRGFGEPNPSLTATYSGFVLGQGPEILDTPAELSTDATTDSSNGLYPIVISGASDSNYDITHVNGFLSVGRTLATLIAEDLQKVYGSPNPSLTFRAVDLIEGHSIADIDTPPTLSTPAKEISDAGDYPVEIQGAEDSEYFFIYQPAVLKILPRNLTVTAEDQTRFYGQTNPALSVVYSGFISGEEASVLDVPPSLSTEALASSPTGEYAIDVSEGKDLNYNFEYNSGVLSVEPAPLTITAENKERSYGQPNPPFTARYSGLALDDTPESVGSKITFYSSASPDSPPGNYPIEISGSVGSNYHAALVNGTLVVNASIEWLKLSYDKENDLVSIAFSGVPESLYAIESSISLDQWERLTDVLTDESGLGAHSLDLDRNSLEVIFLRIAQTSN